MNYLLPNKIFTFVFDFLSYYTCQCIIWCAHNTLIYHPYLVFSINSTEKWILFQLTDRSEIHRHSSLTREHNFQKWKRLRFSWNNQINIVSDFWKFLKIWESKEDIYLYRKTNHSIVQQNIDHHRYERRKSDDYRNFKSEFVNNLKLSQSLNEFWIQLIEFSIILDILLQYHNYWKKKIWNVISDLSSS